MKALIIAAAFAGYVGGQAMAEKPAAQTKVVKTIVQAGEGKTAAVSNCAARKVEVVAEMEEGGKRRMTRIKLCSAVGEDDATWIRSLEDAKAEIMGNALISAESKARIVTELDGEIAKLAH